MFKVSKYTNSKITLDMVHSSYYSTFDKDKFERDRVRSESAIKHIVSRINGKYKYMNITIDNESLKRKRSGKGNGKNNNKAATDNNGCRMCLVNSKLIYRLEISES